MKHLSNKSLPTVATIAAVTAIAIVIARKRVKRPSLLLEVAAVAVVVGGVQRALFARDNLTAIVTVKKALLMILKMIQPRTAHLR